MLARFDRYVLGQLMVVFGFFTLIIVLVYWVNRAITLFDRLVGDGQSTAVFIEFTLLIIPFLMFIVLPMAAFAAAVQVANRLSGESEMVVLRASGISAFRMARPAAVFGVMVCMMMLVLAHVLVPVSRTQLSIREADLAENVTAQFLEAGRFLHPAAGITVFIGEITEAGVLKNVLISDSRDPEVEAIYTAEEALLIRTEDGPRLVLIEGLAQSMTAADNLSLLSFKDVAFDLGALVVPSSRRIVDLRAYPTWPLLTLSPEVLALANATPAQALHEGHTRISKPLTAIFTAIIGFSALLVGSFSRFGFWQQVGWAVFLLVAVQMINNAVENAALRSAAAWPLLYVPVVVSAGISLVLLTIADRPLLPRFARARAARLAGRVAARTGGAA